MSAMQWIHHFDCFLFDFDGLLVDTEPLHYKAYIQVCAEYGLDLTWDINEYGRAAYFHASGLQEALVEEFPAVLGKPGAWKPFYERKKTVVVELMDNVSLMPDVKELLEVLEEAGKEMCVVTHSTKQLVERVRENLHDLGRIKHWITRDDYASPKPAPDGYNLAIERYAARDDRVIGFEDSMKGLKALQATKRALAVLITPFSFVYEEAENSKGVVYAPRFSALAQEALVSR